MNSPQRLVLTTLLTSALAIASGSAQDNVNPPRQDHNEETVAQLQAEMATGRLTSVELTREYISRIIQIDQNGPGVNAVIELNPDALDMARHADQLRRQGIIL